MLIGPFVVMTTNNHRTDDTEIPIWEQGLRSGAIRIEDDVWIGAHVSILAGVTVGAGAVVAAGAVVTKDVPAGSVVGGIPARVISQR